MHSGQIHKGKPMSIHLWGTHFAELWKDLSFRKVTVLSLKPCEAMILPFPKHLSSVTSARGHGMTLLHFPTPRGLGAITFPLCSNSQICIETIPQNYLLTGHIEISIEDRHGEGG